MINIEDIEQSRLELLQQLEAGNDPRNKNRLGQFATPYALAHDIVRYSLSLMSSTHSVRFLEPGFGTGPFFSSLLHLVPTSDIKASLGFEIDKEYYEAAKILWHETSLKLKPCDFTIVEPPRNDGSKFNLVVCNPPYVRHHHLSQIQKLALQASVNKNLGFEMNGLAGLYAYFLVLSQAWMCKEGIGAWLIPSEFMDVKYGRKVKEFLLGRVTLYRIHRFNPTEVQFQDALVSSAVVFFKNAPPSSEQRVQFTFGGSLQEPRQSESIRISELKSESKWTTLHKGVVKQDSRDTSKRLGDLFSIKRGLATGDNSFFILTPEEARRLNLPDEFLRPILPTPRDLGSNEVLADENGEPLIPNRRYLLSCNLPEDEVRKNYTSLWNYLESGIERGVNRRYLCEHRDPWYSQECRPAAALLCSYMGRQSRRSSTPFRFILNLSNATATNSYLMLYQKPVLADAQLNSTKALKALWNALSSITDEVLISEGRVYGGGLHKLEPKELSSVPADELLRIVIDGEELSTYLQPQLLFN
jgi:predicted RNA methylase